MTSERELQSLIFGENEDKSLVAVELAPSHNGQDDMQLFFRTGSDTIRKTEPFAPFLWVESEALLAGYAGTFESLPLKGGNAFRNLISLPSWKDFQKLSSWLKKETGFSPSDPKAPFFFLNDAVQQHLTSTGRTLFKGMLFKDLRRMQVHIAVRTEQGFEFPNPVRTGDQIIAIAMADQSGWTRVLSGAEQDEKTLIDQFVQIVQERDPDVIEGHNIFNFDLPYLFARARRHKTRLAIGRNGREPATRPGRLVTADRTTSYTRFDIHGRHVVDTSFLVQFYDVTHRALDSLGLKDVGQHFGISASSRVSLDCSEFGEAFDRDPSIVLQNVIQEVVEIRALSDMLSGSYFVQAQILPYSYQNVCLRGSGTKADALLLREYRRRLHSVPMPDEPRPFEGGYTDIFLTGVAKNVHHCDIRSLYPSLILRHDLKPRTDELGVFLALLRYLRGLRVDAKKRMNNVDTSEERHHLNAVQTTFKILINSFYGYLGFSQGRFSDFAIAEQVTAEGRALLRRMIDWIREHGGRPVEIDTDGIYFIPPPGDDRELEQFRREFEASLPEGIEIEFDGEYRSMFSYKMKNYALLDDRGEITIKGAALKSRGLEPFQRAFVQDWLRLKLEERDKEIPDLVDRYRTAIEQREWHIRELAKTETLQDSPATYKSKIQAGQRGRNAAYELALGSGRDYKAGDQISYYVTGKAKTAAVHANARLVTNWDPDNRDENIPYYLAKLDALARKFDAVRSDQVELDFG